MFSAAEMLGINKQFAPWLHIQSHLSLALGGGHVYLSRISILQMFDHIRIRKGSYLEVSPFSHPQTNKHSVYILVLKKDLKFSC